MSATAPIPTRDDNLRQALFVPCETKEDLANWTHFYLGLDFPDCIVDPDSNASPLDMIWDLYQAQRFNDRPDLERVMYYASRDSGKTLAASVIEILCVMHLNRSVGHMAAIESQAKNSQRYVKRAFRRPYLREFLVGNNERKIEVVFYRNKSDGTVLTESEWKDLPTETERSYYDRNENSIEIVICTVTGANSLHVPTLVTDELDLAPPGPYEESKYIVTEHGEQMPLTLLISTRKTRGGLVQKEIDTAGKTGLVVKHWNVIDVTRACEPSRHKPELPRTKIWVNDDQLRQISAPEYELLTPEARLKFKEYDAFGGCAACPLFFACKGNLATRQKSTAKLLKSIRYTIGKFKSASPSSAKAQLLCLKPDTEGMIYPYFIPEVHMMTPAAMAAELTGDEYPEKFSKAELIQLFKARDCSFHAGIDHGHTHYFTAVSGARDGDRMFVFDVQAEAELELEDKLNLLRNTIKNWDPEIFADPEDPSSNKSIHRAGFRVRRWDKYQGSVVGGIEIVRSRFRSAIGKPRLFLLKGDPGCEKLAEDLLAYSWKVDAAGRITDQPNKKEDDLVDGLRYLVMNVFDKRGKLTAAKDVAAPTPDVFSQVPTQTNYIKHFIDMATGGDSSGVVGGGGGRGRQGKFVWSIE